MLHATSKTHALKQTKSYICGTENVQNTLTVRIFGGIKFRVFTDFDQIRENMYPQDILPVSKIIHVKEIMKGQQLEKHCHQRDKQCNFIHTKVKMKGCI